MGTVIELIQSEAQQWSAALSLTPHDVYHRPAYARLAARHEGGSPAAIHANDGICQLLIPLLMLPDAKEPTGPSIARSPYGYPCPLIFGGSAGQREAFLETALPKVLGMMSAWNLGSLFVRFHPLLASPTDVFGRWGEIELRGETVSIDLALSLDEMWAQTHARHRNDINRSKRRGDDVYIDEAWRRLGVFEELYEESMRHLNAAPGYYFSADYFRGLINDLGDSARLCVAEVDGQVASAAIFFETSGIVQYHLAATRPHLAKFATAKRIIDFVRGWGKERGNRVLHLGGGVGGNEDSLFFFKAGFSDRRHPYYVWRGTGR